MTAIRHVEIEDSVIDALPPIGAGARLTLRNSDGKEMELPSEVENALLQVLDSLVEKERVNVGPLPELLTSTEAARVLGVSRPTVIRWAQDGFLECELEGTHRRFKRDSVLRVRLDKRVCDWKSFVARREYEKEHGIWE